MSGVSSPSGGPDCSQGQEWVQPSKLLRLILNFRAQKRKLKHMTSNNRPSDIKAQSRDVLRFQEHQRWISADGGCILRRWIPTAPWVFAGLTHSALSIRVVFYLPTLASLVLGTQNLVKHLGILETLQVP